jgi:DNA polymerase-3 subunit epsilon
MGIGEAMDMHDEIEARRARLAKIGPITDVVFVDCETTGLEAGEHEIIEIAAVRINPVTGDHVADLETLVFPTHPETASEDALRINGYDPERWAAAPAIALASALERLNPLLAGACLAGQNPDFDYRFLEAGARATGIKLAKLGSYRKIDVSSLAWPLVMAGLIPSVGLETTTAFFKVPGEKHRAMSDVHRAMAIYRRLVGTFSVAAEQSFLGLERAWCPVCRKNPVAFDGAVYCGAGCAAKGEAQGIPTRRRA